MSVSALLSAFEPAALITDHQGRVQATSHRFCVLVGLGPEAIVGQEQPYPWWPQEQRGWFAAQLGHRLQSATKRSNFEGDHVSADGRRFPVTGSISQLAGAAGEPAGLLWQIRDASEVQAALRLITDRAAEPALDVDLEVGLRRLFESNIIGILTGEGGRITTANDAFLDILGYSRAQFESGGIDWPAVTPPEWLDVDAAAGEQMLRTGSSGPIQKQYIRRDGSRAHVRIAGALVDLEPFRWVAFVEDITEVTRQTERLRAAHEQLNGLFGMAAHDLRTPITTIRGFSDLLVEDLRDHVGPSQLLMLEQIRRSSDRLGVLVDDLLSLSHVEGGHLALDLQIHDLALTAVHAARLLSPIAETKGIAIETEATSTPLRVKIDEGKMEQVFTNLLSNAIKYSPPGTTVRVRAHATEDMATVEFADEGQGIPAHELPLLFRPFSRTSVQPTGGEPSTGLGLAISKRIVEGHAGHISVDSVVGVGSTFRVVLPRPSTFD